MVTLKEPILQYWYRALHAPLGVEIACSNPNVTKAQLYRARSEARDTDLNGVSICVSPFDPSKLWLVKRGDPKDAS